MSWGGGGEIQEKKGNFFVFERMKEDVVLDKWTEILGMYNMKSLNVMISMKIG